MDNEGVIIPIKMQSPRVIIAELISYLFFHRHICLIANWVQLQRTGVSVNMTGSTWVGLDSKELYIIAGTTYSNSELVRDR